MFLIIAAVTLAFLVGFVFDLLPVRLFARKFAVPRPSSSAVFITGASSGLGNAFAKDLAEKGFLVFGTVRKQADADRLTSENEELETFEGSLHPILLDVTDGDAIPAALEEVQSTLTASGRTLCALVNNAGILGILETKEFVGSHNYERVFDTNVFGVVRVTKAFLPLLKAHGTGGRIVNLGSYFGDFGPGVADLAQYVSSKYAVEGLSDVWRRDLRRAGIAVALIKPGDFSTNMNPLVGASRDFSVVVNAVGDAISSPKPLTRYHTGNVCQVGNVRVSVFSRLLHVLPDRLADLIIP